MPLLPYHDAISSDITFNSTITAQSDFCPLAFALRPLISLAASSSFCFLSTVAHRPLLLLAAIQDPLQEVAQPKRLLELGYTFRFPTLDAAVRNSVSK